MSSEVPGGEPRVAEWKRPDPVALVREHLDRNPDDVDALFVLAALRAREGRLEEGLRILNRVLVIDPMYPGAWFFKEKLHRLRGEPEAAEAARRIGEASGP